MGEKGRTGTLFVSRSRARERGDALLETALCLPLFLAMVYGLWAVVAFATLKLHAAQVAHAVAHEVARGVDDRRALQSLADGYLKAVTDREDLVVSVLVSPASAPPSAGLLAVLAALAAPEFMQGTRVEVTAVLRLRRPLARLMPGGYRVTYRTVCLSDPWMSPGDKLAGMFGL